MTSMIILQYNDYIFESIIFYLNVFIGLSMTLIIYAEKLQTKLISTFKFIIFFNNLSLIIKYMNLSFLKNNIGLILYNTKDYYNYRSRNLSIYKPIIWVLNTEDFIEILRFIFDCIFYFDKNDKIELYNNNYYHSTNLIMNMYYINANLYYIMTFIALCFNLIYDKINNKRQEPIYKYYYNNTDNCPICLENINSNKNKWIILSICKHIFHEKCITKWIFTPNGNNCPVCRRKIY